MANVPVIAPSVHGLRPYLYIYLYGVGAISFHTGSTTASSCPGTAGAESQSRVLSEPVHSSKSSKSALGTHLSLLLLGPAQAVILGLRPRRQARASSGARRAR